MRHLITAIALAATAAVFAVSAYMNWSFGLTKASNSFNANVWGILSVALDCLKAALPIFIAAQLKRQRKAVTALSCLILAGAITYSIFSSLGFAATTKSVVNDKRQAIITASKTIDHRLARKRQSLRAIGDSRSTVTIANDIATVKRHYRWQSSKQCTDDTHPKSIALCDKYRDLLRQQSKHPAGTVLR